MRRLFISILANSVILLPIICIYSWMVNDENLYKWIFTFLTFTSLVFCLIYLKDVQNYFRNSSIDRFISLIGLEIALLAFIQTNIQFVKSNELFEQNRIASGKLFEQQIKHSEKLNQIQIENSKNLNKVLTDELIQLQDINTRQSESAENQLLATKSQLELSEQSLQDYLFDTKPELSVETTKISNIDTLDDSNVKLTITSNIKNKGRREAKSVEFRQIIIFTNESVTILNVMDETEFFTSNKIIGCNYSQTVPIDMTEDFYYWLQIRYLDEKTGSQIDRSFYFHYIKYGKGFGFYLAKRDDKKILRKIIDKELENKGYSLTTN